MIINKGEIGTDNKAMKAIMDELMDIPKVLSRLSSNVPAVVILNNCILILRREHIHLTVEVFPKDAISEADIDFPIQELAQEPVKEAKKEDDDPIATLLGLLAILKEGTKNG